MVNTSTTYVEAENSIRATNNIVKHVDTFVFSVRYNLICPILLNSEEIEKQLTFSESCEERFIYCQLQRMGLFLYKQAIALH